MRENCAFAAVWRLKVKDQVYEVVPTEQLQLVTHQAFTPTSQTDFNSETLYILKSPGQRSSFVSILKLGESRSDIKHRMEAKRIAWPCRKKFFDRMNVGPTSSDENRTSQSQVIDEKKAQGKLHNMKNIVQQYKLTSHRDKPYTKSSQVVKTSSNASISSRPSTSANGKATLNPVRKENTIKAKLNQFHAPRTNISVVAEGSSESRNTSSQLKTKEQVSGEPALLEERSSPLLLNSLEEMKMLRADIEKAQRAVSLDRQRAADERKLAESEREKVEAEREKVEAESKKVEDALKVIVEERKAMERERRNMETVLADFTKRQRLMDESLASMKSKVSNTAEGTSTSSSEASAVEEIPPKQLVHLGKMVYATNELWQKAKSSSSKEDWAAQALVALFGEEAAFYRMRKPRSKDTRLKVLPRDPPYLKVLQAHYKLWLGRNSAIMENEIKNLDDLRQKRALKKIEKSREVAAVTDNAEREASLLSSSGVVQPATLDDIINSLAELLGNKATDLYRNLSARQSKKLNNTSFDEDVDDVQETDNLGAGSQERENSETHVQRSNVRNSGQNSDLSNNDLRDSLELTPTSLRMMNSLKSGNGNSSVITGAAENEDIFVDRLPQSFSPLAHGTELVIPETEKFVTSTETTPRKSQMRTSQRRRNNSPIIAGAAENEDIFVDRLPRSFSPLAHGTELVIPETERFLTSTQTTPKRSQIRKKVVSSPQSNGEDQFTNNDSNYEYDSDETHYSPL